MLDLTLANAGGEDIGNLSGYLFEAEWGVDEDDERSFDLTLPIDHPFVPIAPGSILYAEGTELGGIVERCTVDTETRHVVYSGPTAHGLLQRHVLCPASGETHWTFSGDANAVLRAAVSDLGISDLFHVPDDAAGIAVSGQVRYEPAYTSLARQFAVCGAKILATWDGPSVEISAAPAGDYSDDELDSFVADYKLEVQHRPVNHLVCLGAGELLDRLVVHLYMGPSGVTQTRPTTVQGAWGENAEVYENTGDDEVGKLVEDGTSKLVELNEETASIEVGDGDAPERDVGDIVSASDWEADLHGTAKITAKVVTMERGEPVVATRIGKQSAQYWKGRIS